MPITDLVRPNIRKLKPFRCARDDFKEGLLLDANENTHGVAVNELSNNEKVLQLNRYPDPHQLEVKELICKFRNSQAIEEGLEANLRPDNVRLGVGSDELIDALVRTVCTPGKDKLMITSPTFGMYSLCADLNDVEVIDFSLNLTTFELRVDDMLQVLNSDNSIKLVFVCSPGNPSGKAIPFYQILKLLDLWKGGLVAVDEAYVDFTKPSIATLVNKYENLVVMQTLSKSFGLAGLRLGILFSCPDLSIVFNSIKAPYNISSATSELAKRALLPENIKRMQENVQKIMEERTRLAHELPKIKGVGKIVGGLDANFVLAQIVDSDGQVDNGRATRVYSTLAKDHRVVVRFRGNEIGCDACLRISIGTHEENTELLQKLDHVLQTTI